MRWTRDDDGGGAGGHRAGEERAEGNAVERAARERLAGEIAERREEVAGDDVDVGRARAGKLGGP